MKQVYHGRLPSVGIFLSCMRTVANGRTDAVTVRDKVFSSLSLGCGVLVTHLLGS